MTIAARPTTYNGVEMRSRMEARYAAAFDDGGIEWRYEPRAYASEQGQYLPDFEVYLHTSEGRQGPIFVELKPASLTVGELESVLSRMLIVRASVPDAMLWLMVDGAELIFSICGDQEDWKMTSYPPLFSQAVAYGATA